MDAKTLDILFTYHPPTPTTAPLYKITREAESYYLSVLNKVHSDISCLVEPSEKEYIAAHNEITLSARMFLEAIDPCVQEAHGIENTRFFPHVDLVIKSRMWANKGVRAKNPGDRASYFALARTVAEETILYVNASIATKLRD